MAESIKDKVYKAVVDIHLAGNSPGREAVRMATGLDQRVVDDNLKRLVGDERLVRPIGTRGVYRPTEVYREDQAISWTVLPNGMYRLEKGDLVHDFTPREYGWLFSFARLQTQEPSKMDGMAVILIKQMTDRQNKLERELGVLRAKKKQPRQLALCSGRAEKV